LEEKERERKEITLTTSQEMCEYEEPVGRQKGCRSSPLWRSERSPETIDALSKRRGFSLDGRRMACRNKQAPARKNTRVGKRTNNKIPRDTKREKAEVMRVDNNEIEDWRIGGLRRRGGERIARVTMSRFFLVLVGSYQENKVTGNKKKQ
jgi:hypothetical protein